MKVHMIYPCIGIRPTFHCGLGVLSAVLKREGHSVELMILESKAGIPATAGKIGDSSPDLILISCYSNAWRYVKELCAGIRSTRHVPVFVGGPHATFCPETMQETADVDDLNLLRK